MYKRTVFVLTAVCLAVLGTAYGVWFFTVGPRTVAAGISSLIVTALFGIVGAYALRDLFWSWEGAPELDIAKSLGKRSLRQGHRHPVLRLFLALLLFRLLVYVAAYALSVLINGYEGALLDTLSLWRKGDAPHYLGIAENWYVTEGDPRFHIVFFPLYPIVVRLVNFIVNNTFVSGLFVSLTCTVIAGMLLYELALLDMDRASAKRAVKFQMLLPAAFLLNAPMSDGLFLLLSIACMLLARKKRYILACLIGGLASFTRVLGVVLLAPVLVELISDAIRLKKEAEKGKVLFFLLPRLISLLLIPMGLLLYLVVNQQVTGDPFTFLTYQNEHWNQRMGWFFNTAAYQTNYLLDTIHVNQPQAYGLWLPNLIFLLASPLVVLFAQRRRKPPKETQGGTDAYRLVPPPEQPYRLRASYQVYFLCYYFAGMGATWLLSAPRYLTCCFPLSLAFAAQSKHRAIISLLYALLFVMQLLYMAAYVAGWPVY